MTHKRRGPVIQSFVGCVSVLNCHISQQRIINVRVASFGVNKLHSTGIWSCMSTDYFKLFSCQGLGTEDTKDVQDTVQFSGRRWLKGNLIDRLGLILKPSPNVKLISPDNLEHKRLNALPCLWKRESNELWNGLFSLYSCVPTCGTKKAKCVFFTAQNVPLTEMTFHFENRSTSVSTIFHFTILRCTCLWGFSL